MATQELIDLLQDLGYSDLESSIDLLDILSSLDLSELSEEDRQLIEDYISNSPSDKDFWIDKIITEFKSDISLLDTYSAEELKDIYQHAISDKSILSVYHFLKRDIRVKRAGIIPMIKRGGHTFYGLGLDQSSGDITEFAGGREGKDKDMLETALREFKEETFGIFNIDRKMVEEQNNDVLFDSYSCIFLVQIDDKNFMSLVDKFNLKIKEMKKNKIKIENGLLFWVTGDQLRTLLASKRPNPYLKYPIFFHYPTRKLLTLKFGNLNDCDL